MMLVRELDKQEKILLSVLPKHIAYEVFSLNRKCSRNTYGLEWRNMPSARRLKCARFQVKDDMEGREKEQMFHKIYIRKHENIR